MQGAGERRRADDHLPAGLDVEGVLDTAIRTLGPGGWFLMEFGYGQEQGVRRLVEARPTLRLDRIRPDLQGIARTAIMQRS